MVNGDFHDMTEREILVKVATKVEYIERNLTESIDELRQELRNNRKIYCDESLDRDKRISSLENWRNYIGGALFIVSAIFSMTYQYMMRRIS